MEFLGAVDLEAVTITDKVIVEKADNHRSKQTLSCNPGSKATTLTRQVISLRLAEISCQVIRIEDFNRHPVGRTQFSSAYA